MIQSIDIKDPKQTPLKWLETVPALAQPRKFDFKPGLNILWGKNGSGKSTVLQLIGRLMHCSQGGEPCITRTSVENVVTRQHWTAGRTTEEEARQGLERMLKALVIEHDGQPVRFFDPGNATGLLGGGAAFDDDFFSMGVANATFKGSSGQQTMFRFDALAGEILERKVPTMKRKGTEVMAKDWNSVWANYLRIAEEFLKPTIEKGPLTVLLDEPERSYDLPTQVKIWKFIRAYATDVQFIIASHSFYALRIPEAHYIEMVPGYLAEATRCVEFLERWPTDKSEQIPPELLPLMRKGKGK